MNEFLFDYLLMFIIVNCFWFIHYLIVSYLFRCSLFKVVNEFYLLDVLIYFIVFAYFYQTLTTIEVVNNFSLVYSVVYFIKFLFLIFFDLKTYMSKR